MFSENGKTRDTIQWDVAATSGFQWWHGRWKINFVFVKKFGNVNSYLKMKMVEVLFLRYGPGVTHWGLYNMTVILQTTLHFVFKNVFWFELSKFVFNGAMNHKPALFQIMDWRETGGKLLSKPMMASWMKMETMQSMIKEAMSLQMMATSWWTGNKELS